MEDKMTFKLKDASENVGKDELGDASFHLRVDKLFPSHSCRGLEYISKFTST
jgi:hypothetical protein